ncbi:16S rRNA (uracil(1498)-N(3))-methyltransferase [Campylobacter sp. RM9344]|uniref:Ribosomal RNA small subunit methyltransferase E n=1 Tax=Campylobacter californiensis TaxID=1032243 RepID=A0AAW3ZR34_9BACT|nr:MULTISPECIES: 16S rRNA (uracil(1498)-N(3))-methyltransferase [unclassified Campylobacter]MBE2984575.1 16S rRNA (uracil(1498)-N(3))-methyltransferase [Campylobacter sp. RM6883]MBE2987042.1 16S rRNA (uracil(1498)-N(3))-methyltransferase [Campylobacter sp. RM12919]MBE2988671.1 16S rRNA (uracil(1498)-N(3))-methyltransferase [Campylobacter sp. RM12920]MBE2995137.1 16S rRNA (uracil(1498)-N(3))-methyltransferase [Campylobacter sp. RM6913]MBE3021676.1 16S rRNA (uracil(1498)-N(3))-methyltransferase 
MKFLYDERAGCEQLKVVNETFLHLKARRNIKGDRVSFRNLKDGKDYLYEIIEFDRRSAILELVFTSSVPKVVYDFSIAWAVVDPKTIEKALPFLNELGVGKLIFVYTKFSQANFKIDFERLEYICALSCEQSGRSTLMEFEIYNSLDEFLDVYQNVAAINFNGKSLEKYSNELLLIGPEGGFAPEESLKLQNQYSLKTQNILKSQTAIISIASKFLV